MDTDLYRYGSNSKVVVPVIDNNNYGHPGWLRREPVEDDAHIREYERQPLKWKPEVFSAPPIFRAIQHRVEKAMGTVLIALGVKVVLSGSK